MRDFRVFELGVLFLGKSFEINKWVVILGVEK